jgi:hypothetical protein
MPPPTSLLDRAQLHRDSVRQQIARALSGVDDGELHLEYSQTEWLTFDNGRLEEASYDIRQGVSLRAAIAVGCAHSSDLSLAALIRAADAVSAMRGGYSGTFAAPPARTNVRLYGDGNPLDGPAFETKVKLLAEIDACVRAKEPLCSRRRYFSARLGRWSKFRGPMVRAIATFAPCGGRYFRGRPARVIARRAAPEAMAAAKATLVAVEGHRWAIEDSFEAAKNEFGLDHNESRSWHGWHRHVSLAMLAFAMMAAIRHRANPPPPKKRNGAHQQNPKHNHAATDPLVNAGNPSHCHQTRSKAHSTGPHHRMVLLAQSPPGCRSTSSLQIKKTTVMLAATGQCTGQISDCPIENNLRFFPSKVPKRPSQLSRSGCRAQNPRAVVSWAAT